MGQFQSRVIDMSDQLNIDRVNIFLEEHRQKVENLNDSGTSKIKSKRCTVNVESSEGESKPYVRVDTPSNNSYYSHEYKIDKVESGTDFSSWGNGEPGCDYCEYHTDSLDIGPARLKSVSSHCILDGLVDHYAVYLTVSTNDNKS